MQKVKRSVLFIVGVGRSGTSLLQSMFASHSSVEFLPETSFLRRYVVTQRLTTTYKLKGEAGVVGLLESDPKVSRLQLDIPRIVAEALRRSGTLEINLYDLIIEDAASSQSHEVIWVGDKDPKLIEHLSIVDDVCSSAYVVHIVRDPRDVVASKKKAEWSKERHVWQHILAGCVQYKMGRTFGETKIPGNYVEIKYEYLISNPERVLSKLCESMGLTYEEGMLSFGVAAESLTSKSELSWKKETLGPLLVDNKDKWRKELSPREVLLIELCCKKQMTDFDYASSSCSRKVNFLGKLWVAIGYAVIKSAVWPYILYRSVKRMPRNEKS